MDWQPPKKNLYEVDPNIYGKGKIQDPQSYTEFPREPEKPGYVWLINVSAVWKDSWERGAKVTDKFKSPLSSEEALRKYSEKHGIPEEDLLVVQATLSTDSLAVYRKIKPETNPE